MGIALTPETQKLIEEKLRKGGYSTADDMVRAALEMLDDYDAELDNLTLDAIDRAEAQYERGEGMPADEAFAQLRRKHFGA